MTENANSARARKLSNATDDLRRLRGHRSALVVLHSESQQLSSGTKPGCVGTAEPSKCSIVMVIVLATIQASIR